MATTLKALSVTTALVLACTVGFAVAPAQTKPIPKFLKVDTNYAPYRKRLMRNGWKIYGNVVRDAVNCPDYDTRCTTFPEAQECSGTGLGFCNMVWKHKDGTILVINTAGEEDPGIVAINLE